MELELQVNISINAMEGPQQYTIWNQFLMCTLFSVFSGNSALPLTCEAFFRQGNPGSKRCLPHSLAATSLKLKITSV